MSLDTDVFDNYEGKEPNERMENERIIEEMRQQLFTAIQMGDETRADQIRKDLIETGLLSSNEVEELEETL